MHDEDTDQDFTRNLMLEKIGDKLRTLEEIRDELKAIRWALFAIAAIAFGALMNWLGNLHPFWKGWQ